VGGLIVVLVQLGVIGKAEPQPVSSQTPVVVQSSGRTGEADGAGSQGPGSNPSVSSKPASWEEIRARWTPTSGPQRVTPASTVRYCISVGEGIKLDDTQDVPFEKMRKLTIVGTPPPALTPGGHANLRIDLVSGRTITGTIDVNCDFIGNDDIGRFSYYPDRLRSIEFLWDQ
jgi:serine/threonine-protein kinase